MELFILSQPMSIAHGLVRQNSRKAIDRRPLCRESLFEIYENRRRTGRRRLMAAKRRRTTLWRVLVSFSSSNRAWFGSRTLFPKNKRKAHDMFSFSPQSLNVSAPPLFHRRTQSNRPWTIRGPFRCNSNPPLCEWKVLAAQGHAPGEWKVLAARSHTSSERKILTAQNHAPRASERCWLLKATPPGRVKGIGCSRSHSPGRVKGIDCSRSRPGWVKGIDHSRLHPCYE